MVDFKDIDKARRLLGLGESATLTDIKKAYYRLAKKYHPDKHIERDKTKYEDRFKKINKAYETIMAYCAGCEFSFRKEDIKKSHSDFKLKEDMERFYKGWY